MNFFCHADYAFNSPDNWEDGSIVTLIGPTDSSLPPPNLTITRETVSEGTTAETYAINQREILMEAFASQKIDIVAEWAGNSQSGPVYCRTHRLFLDDGSRAIVQHQGYVVLGTNVLILTAVSYTHLTLPTKRIV